MIGALRRRFSKSGRARAAYDRACAEILQTPPLETRDATLRVLSMMCHRDVIPYLVAIKSLYGRIGEGRIVLLDDGTLTGADRDLLDRHLGGVAFIDIGKVDTGICPRGGCWERLLSILGLTGDCYVIQLDADTVTTDAVDEVIRCYRENRSFTLGTPSGARIAPMADVSPRVREWMDEQALDTLQLRAEAVFDQLPDSRTRTYVRGSAGFAGFARGAVARANAEAFSQEVEARLGPLWHQWGSEQVASNYLIANAPDAVVLPQPKYACYQPGVPWQDCAFLHFFGTYRYRDGIYTRLSRGEIERLNR